MFHFPSLQIVLLCKVATCICLQLIWETTKAFFFSPDERRRCKSSLWPVDLLTSTKRAQSNSHEFQTDPGGISLYVLRAFCVAVEESTAIDSQPLTVRQSANREHDLKSKCLPVARGPWPASHAANSS